MIDVEKQNDRAQAFRSMHRGPKVLLLPNIWDVASARVIQQAGFGALATTSAGIAFTLGYPDGQKIPRQEMLAQVARIVRAVKIPVTADVEAGYGDRPEDAAETARGVIDAGAIGMNLEDGTDRPGQLVEMSLQLEKIHAIRKAVVKSGVLLVLNARTDVYLESVGALESRYEETVRRLLAYREAGADCVFAPGVGDVATISRLVQAVKCPLNILAGPGSPSVLELEKIGVARVSLGSAPMRATLGLLSRMAEELKTAGTYKTLEGAPAHSDVNRMLR